MPEYDGYIYLLLLKLQQFVLVLLLSLERDIPQICTGGGWRVRGSREKTGAQKEVYYRHILRSMFVCTCIELPFGDVQAANASSFYKQCVGCASMALCQQHTSASFAGQLVLR